MIEACSPDRPIDEAATIREAMALWEAHHHDVVFLDLVLLGDPSGGEASLRSAAAVGLAQHLVDQRPAPRIVLASALHPDHPHMRAARPLASAVVGKPFRAEDVRRALEGLA